MHRANPALLLLATLALALVASPSDAQIPTVLATFNGTNGQAPYGDLTLSGSTLYGMTSQGGAYGDGEIFSVPVTGGTPTVLFSFNGTNGINPYGSLTLSGSTLYGMTSSGGAYGDGTIFSIGTNGSGFNNLFSFNGTDGAYPQGSLTLSGSTLYGMTYSGGSSGDGVIFSISVTGSAPTTLASFNGADGAYPGGSLTLVGSTLYGMTSGGGAYGPGFGDGTIFSIPMTGGAPTTLHSFNGMDGSEPVGSLTLSGSTLYGTASAGGSGSGDGTIFSIPTTGGTLTTLAAFNGTDGASPYSSLTLRAYPRTPAVRSATIAN